MSNKAKKRMIQDSDSDDEQKEQKPSTSKVPSYLKAGEDFLEIMKKGAENFSIPENELNMDLLLGTPPKKNKHKKSKKDKKEEKKKNKKSKPKDDEMDLTDEDVEEEEEEDEEAMQRALDNMRRMQRNRDRMARRKEMDEAPDEAAELLAYLEANKCDDDDDLETSAIYIEDENPNKEQTVMVRWRFGNIEKHKMKLVQPFEYLYDFYAERENIPVSCVSFETCEGTQIYPTDTLKKLNLKLIDIIDGSILQKTDDQETEEVDTDDGKIDIKFQLKNQKEHICVRIYPHNPLKKALLQVAAKLDLPIEKMRLHFDGDLVDLEETPKDLDIDGGEVFDLQILD